MIIVVVVVVLVASSIVMSAVLYFLVSGLTTSQPSSQPLGVAFALGYPTESVGEGYHYYNFSVIAILESFPWDDLRFSVLTGAGLPISQAGTSVGILSEAVPVASYALAGNSWTAGGASNVVSGQIVSVDTLAISASSGMLVVSAVGGPCSGTVSFTIS